MVFGLIESQNSGFGDPLVLAGITLVYVALVVVAEYSWTSGRDGLLPNRGPADETPERESTEKT